jgi:hypothetical protein
VWNGQNKIRLEEWREAHNLHIYVREILGGLAGCTLHTNAEMKMRASGDICLLCEKRKATQKKSHIIPKFFGKGLYYDTSPKHSISFKRTGQTSKIQEIEREDFILCPECEKGFSVLETYCALRLERFNEIRFANNFNHIKRGEFEFFECKNLDIKVFNLFIYSIVWRLSISEKYSFEQFKLNQTDEIKLKDILKKYIKFNENDLFKELADLKELPGHSHVIIRPNKKLRPPNSMLSAASRTEWLHELHLVDYMVFYLTDKDKLVDGFKEINNNNLENFVKVGLTTPERWKSYNYDLINKIFK